MKQRISIPFNVVKEHYVLVRERDNLIIEGSKIGWVEWKENGTFNQMHDEIGLGRSLLVDPHRLSYSWLTTIVTEILDTKENYIKFRTSNSVYELKKVIQDGNSNIDI